MNEIFWPAGYVPGFTDNFASNAVSTFGFPVEAQVTEYLPPVKKDALPTVPRDSA